MNKPKVSIIVPIYNAEEFLHRCVDSLVYQTLEDLEILLVDNQSEDSSFEIMKEYVKRFPEKVYAYQLDKHYNGPGAGRNLGLKYAKADYIGFSDSDDYFEYNAMEKMYQKAITEDCDLVYCASYDVKEGKKKLTRNLPTGSREEILTIGSMVFWNKLFHKSLFEKKGKIPEDMVFEDLAYCPGIVSIANKIGYIDEPLYYYIIRENSGVNTLDPDRVLKELDAMEISLKECSRSLLDVYIDSVGMRLCNDIRDRWQFADAYIREIKKLRPYLESSKFLAKDKRNYPRVTRYLELPEETIPNILYIPNFKGVLTRKEIEEYKEKAFYNGTELCILDKNSCNINEKIFLEKALEEEKFNLLDFYFGLKSIYEKGGVYIHPSIQLHAPLNCIKYNEAFFSYLNKNSFSDRIFGGKRNNEVIGRIIEVVEEQGSMSVPREILYEILHEEKEIPMSDETEIFKYEVSVYDTSVFVIDVGEKMHIAEHF